MIKNNPLWEPKLLLLKIKEKQLHDTKQRDKITIGNKTHEEQTQIDIYLENKKTLSLHLRFRLNRKAEGRGTEGDSVIEKDTYLQITSRNN